MGCPVCGRGSCTHAPDVAHLISYPFLPGGRDPLAGQIAGRDFIYCTEAIYDRSPGVERCIYGVGDPIPMEKAIELGLVEKPEPIMSKTGRARRPKADRMHRPEDDR